MCRPVKLNSLSAEMLPGGIRAKYAARSAKRGKFSRHSCHFTVLRGDVGVDVAQAAQRFLHFGPGGTEIAMEQRSGNRCDVQYDKRMIRLKNGLLRGFRVLCRP